MWCTQRHLAVPDMMGQKAAYISQKATTAVTFTDGVGGLAVDELKPGKIPIFHRAHVMQR